MVWDKEHTKQYHTWAHNYPVVITTTMLFLLLAITEFLLWSDISIIVRIVSSVIGASFVVAFGFLCARIIRRISKDILEDRIIFQPRLKPTNRVMFKSNKAYTLAYKKRILERLEKDGVWLLSTQPKDADSKAYIQAIEDAHNHVLEATRQDAVLFDRNCFYGFARNLFGGLFLNSSITIFLMVIVWWGGYDDWKVLSDALGIEVLLLIFNAFMTYREGMDYAKRLYVAYLES